MVTEAHGFNSARSAGLRDRKLNELVSVCLVHKDHDENHDRCERFAARFLCSLLSRDYKRIQCAGIKYFICFNMQINSGGKLSKAHGNKTGEITKKIADEFFGIANGLKPDRFGWLTPVKVDSSEPVTA